MGRIRKMFAGGNTSLGFYSFFDFIIGDDAEQVFLLKGGPGTGKSVFMKEIAEAVLKAGYEGELFYCSSDRESLDGAAFPQLGVALIDATAPHAQEPRLPGCRDELINLGNFWNRQGIRKHRKAVEKASLENQRWFQSAFRYLRAAYAVEENIEMWNRSVISPDKGYEIGTELLDRIFRCQGNEKGSIRHLFASAITPQGKVSFIENLVEGFEERYILEGPLGVEKSVLLQRILNRAREMGIKAEAFHYPLNPEKIEHILLPELQVAIISASDHDFLKSLEGHRINLAQDFSEEDWLSDDYALREQLIQRAIHMLGGAKEVHDELESYYASQMDFAALDELKETVLGRILG